MALYDNKHWLLSHIRHSYISSDDTGFSEMVMLGDDIRSPNMEVLPGLGDDEEEEDGDLLSQSFDIQSDLDFGAHRQRSNTAQRLEKMEKEWKKAAKIKNVKWETPKQQIPAEETENMFERKILKPKKEGEITKRTSILASQLKNTPYIPQNPYLEFSKHDGSSQVGVSVRRYAIFLTMMSSGDRDYPLQVTVVSCATVRELVGLALWRCSVERGTHLLQGDVSQFALYIAEDDGEVDWDFPCLDPNETVAKFGFSYLALVNRASGSGLNPAATMSLPLDKAGTSLAERDEIEIGGALDQAMKLQAQQEAEQRMQGHMTAMEAPLYQSYQVNILNKVRAASAVHLGISGEKLEIDPVVHHKPSSLFWTRRKAAQYDMSNIAACELSTNKPSSKVGFRLVIQPQGEVSSSSSMFKNLDFEAESSMSQEIVQKVNHILELRAGPARREYLVYKERKSQRRRSFNLSLR